MLRLARTFPSSALGALLACLPSALSGQLVRGTVTERGGATPVVGVVITLTSAEGSLRRAALTDSTGRFAVAAPAPGVYAIEAKRIGVRKTVTDTFTLAADAVKELSIVVELLPAIQPRVVVSDRRQCDAALTRNEATAALWEDARAALTAQSLTSAAARVRMVRVQYQRDLEPRALLARSDHRDTVAGITSKPFVSADPADLSRRGYVVSVAGGGVQWRAPDADVLLSESFVREHCFHSVRGVSADSALVGLAFEPTSDRHDRRDLTDIKGVLWLDAASRNLRRADFTWTPLPDVEGSEKLGGRVEFEHLTSGEWIVARWRVRAPILRQLPARVFNNSGSLVATRRIELDAIREVGGAVLGTSLALEAVAPPALATLSGTVVDSVRRTPVAGADVVVEGTLLATRTDSGGRFAIRGISQGTHSLVIRKLGFRPFASDVAFSPGDSTDVIVRVSSADVVLDTVNVKARAALPLGLADFERRRATAHATFITQDVLDKRSGVELTNIIAGAASGIRLVHRANGGWLVASSRPATCISMRCPPSPLCYLAVWLDGQPIFRPSASDSAEDAPDLTQFHPEQLAGVEVYTDIATIPPELNMTGSSCGVIALWTRRGSS